MSGAARTILSTRPLSPAAISKARAAGWEVEEQSFIRTEPVQDAALQAEIRDWARQPLLAIFTSMNAVQAVADMLGVLQPAWRVACLGHTTRLLVNTLLPNATIVATGNHAAELAHNMAEKAEGDKLVFFCSQIRRDTLPEYLAAQGLPLTERVVYKTTETPMALHRSYDAILFFSPSAVRSFFRLNQLPPETVLFATGETTAAELRAYSQNQVVVADGPGKDTLIETLLSWYASGIA